MAMMKMGRKSLLHPMPAVLVGTWNEDGTPDAMTAAWSAVCCQDPPSVGVAVRKNRLTFANIERTRAFTVNVPPTRIAIEVDYVGIVSGKDEPAKLARAGLETFRADVVDAPILTDCSVCIECRLSHALEIGTHTWFVGEVVETHVVEDAVGRDGKLDLSVIDPLVYCTGTRGYYSVGERVGGAFDIGKKLR